MRTRTCSCQGSPEGPVRVASSECRISQVSQFVVAEQEEACEPGKVLPRVDELGPPRRRCVTEGAPGVGDRGDPRSSSALLLPLSALSCTRPHSSRPWQTRRETTSR